MLERGKGSYEDIKKYISIKYGVNVKNAHIAHVKELCGLPVKKAYNRTEKNYRKYPCPEKNIKIIKEALKQYKLI